MLHHFHTPVADIPLPERFTFPFCYTPHPLCVAAAKEVQAYLGLQEAWKEELAQGKMFGVLVGPFEEFDEGQAHAFRGQKNGIRLNLKKDAEPDDHAAEQAENNGPQVSVRFQRCHEPHGKIRQNAEDKNNGNLEQMSRTELSFQQGRLHGHKTQMHEDGDGSHG